MRGALKPSACSCKSPKLNGVGFTKPQFSVTTMSSVFLLKDAHVSRAMPGMGFVGQGRPRSKAASRLNDFLDRQSERVPQIGPDGGPLLGQRSEGPDAWLSLGVMASP